MDTFYIKIVITIFFIFLNILSGIILTVKGKPYNQLTANIHKFSSLIFGITVVFIIINLLRKNNINFSKSLLIISTGLMFIASLATGGLLIGLKNTNRIILYMHRVISFLSVIFIIITLYLFMQ